MKDYYKNASTDSIEKKKDTMSSAMTKFYDSKRAQLLANLDIEFGEDFAKYIRLWKKDDIPAGYVIRINRKVHCQLVNSTMSLQEKYDNLHQALRKAYEIQKSRKLDSSDDQTFAESSDSDKVDIDEKPTKNKSKKSEKIIKNKKES